MAVNSTAMLIRNAPLFVRFPRTRSRFPQFLEQRILIANPSRVTSPSPASCSKRTRIDQRGVDALSHAGLDLGVRIRRERGEKRRERTLQILRRERDQTLLQWLDGSVANGRLAPIFKTNYFAEM